MLRNKGHAVFVVFGFADLGLLALLGDRQPAWVILAICMLALGLVRGSRFAFWALFCLNLLELMSIVAAAVVPSLETPLTWEQSLVAAMGSAALVAVLVAVEERRPTVEPG